MLGVGGLRGVGLKNGSDRGSGFRFRVSVQVSGLRVEGSKFGVRDSGFEVWDMRLRLRV